LFVNCQITYTLWNWISIYNGFTFQGIALDDLWFIDSCIPFKDRLLIELIRSAVIWVLWIERNEIIFKSKKHAQVRTLGLKIISLFKFWCTVRNAFQLLKLSLVLPQGGRGASFAGHNTFRGGRTIRGRGASYDTQSNVWKRPNSDF
jgi:hypothetical protein